MSSYNIKLSNGNTLIDIKPLEGNGLGNTSTLLQVYDIEYSDASFGLPLGSRPDAFIVGGDVRTQYLQGKTFTVSGNTGYDGAYTVNLTGFNAGDQVAQFVGGRTHIPVSAISVGHFDIVGVVTGVGGSFKVAGTDNSIITFLPTRTFTVADNSNAPSNGVYTIASVAASSVYEIDSFDLPNHKLIILGDKTAFFSASALLNISGTLNGLGEGTYRALSVTLTGGNTHIVVDTTYRDIPTSIITIPKPQVAPKIPLAIITVTGTINGSTTATGTVTPQSPTTAVHPLSPTITPTTPGNYLITWHIEGQLAAQLVAGTLVQVKDARYNSSRYTTSFAITTVSEIAPNITYPSGLTEVVMALVDSAVTTPIITTDTSSRFIFPIPSSPFGFVGYNTDDIISSLYLVGQGAPSYSDDKTWGNALQTNLVHLTENFADALPPIAPLLGQLWQDTTTPALRRFTGATYPVLNVVTGVSGNWQLDMRAVDAPANGGTLIVYSNNGLNMVPVEYVVASSSEAVTPGTQTGYTTTVVITGTIPSAASSIESSNLAAPYGYAYDKADWLDVVTSTAPVQNFVDMNNNKIINLANATNAQDALNLQTGDLRYVNVVGDTMTGTLAMTTGADITLDTGNVTVTAGDIVVTSGNVSIPAGFEQFGTATNGVTISNNGAAAPTVTFVTSSAIPNSGNEVINLGGNKIVNLTNPSNALDAVNKSYVDSLANGIIWLQPIADPNLFDDSLTAPPVTPDVFTRSYIVPTGATGAWSTLVGRAVTWDGTTWIDILGRAVAIGDRFGVLIDPDNDELGSLPPTGGGLTNHAAQIATVTGVSPYTYTFYTPTEPDAVSVTGKPLTSSNQIDHSPHFGHSYTFRGTWAVSGYGTAFQWIEFAGPQMLVDGAGLKYTGNVLNVGQGTGIIVGADTVAFDTTYGNGQYVRLDGTVAMTGSLTLSGAPTANLHAATKLYVDGRTLDNLSDVVITTPIADDFLSYNGTNWINKPLILDSATDVVLTTPATGDTLTYNGTNWVNTPIEYYDTQAVLTNLAGIVNIDAHGDFYTLAIAANVTSVTFSNLPPAGKAKTIEIRITQDSTGGWTFALPASFKAIATSDTAIQSAANSITILTIKTFDQGTRWEYFMKAGTP